jgi:hypothetical protein
MWLPSMTTTIQLITLLLQERSNPGAAAFFLQSKGDVHAQAMEELRQVCDDVERVATGVGDDEGEHVSETLGICKIDFAA